MTSVERMLPNKGTLLKDLAVNYSLSVFVRFSKAPGFVLAQRACRNDFRNSCLSSLAHSMLRYSAIVVLDCGMDLVFSQGLATHPNKPDELLPTAA
jgi:hypothetical protein